MPKKRFSDEQIAFALRQAQAGGGTVGEICRKMGVAEANVTLAIAVEPAAHETVRSTSP